MKPALKCVNLDWLEVFCLEPADMPAQYFQNLGWQVNVREYGTPLYVIDEELVRGNSLKSGETLTR